VLRTLTVPAYVGVPWLLQHEAKWTSNAIEFFNEASAQGGSQLLSTAAESSSQQADGPVSEHCYCFNLLVRPQKWLGAGSRWCSSVCVQHQQHGLLGQLKPAVPGSLQYSSTGR
jgi:hypothetical protein